jgi:hypothetical protein
MAAPKSNEKPILEYEVVERPLGTKTRWAVTEEVQAILNTVDDGKAIKLKFRSADEIKRIQMAIRHVIKNKHDGIRMRYQRDQADANRIIAWAERISDLGQKAGKK